MRYGVIDECYVAGPMRGHALFNFPSFDKWRDALAEHGWVVHSPADMDRMLGLDENDYPDLPDWFTVEDALKRDFEAILRCNAIVLLPGWEKSTGAHAELHVARNIGIHALLAVEDEDGRPLALAELTKTEIDDYLAAGTDLKVPDLATEVACPLTTLGLDSVRTFSEDEQCPDAWDTPVNQRVGDSESGWRVYDGPLNVESSAAWAAGGEVRVTSESGGQKGTKPEQLGAIDPVALQYLGRVAAMGADKYARYNYLRGYDWSLSVDALLRHLCLFLAGEDFDQESGLPHTAHVMWHGACLTSFLVRGIGEDDRPPAWRP